MRREPIISWELTCKPRVFFPDLTCSLVQFIASIPKKPDHDRCVLKWVTSLGKLLPFWSQAESRASHGKPVMGCTNYCFLKNWHRTVNIHLEQNLKPCSLKRFLSRNVGNWIGLNHFLFGWLIELGLLSPIGHGDFPGANGFFWPSHGCFGRHPGLRRGGILLWRQEE